MVMRYAHEWLLREWLLCEGLLREWLLRKNSSKISKIIIHTKHNFSARRANYSSQMTIQRS